MAEYAPLTATLFTPMERGQHEELWRLKNKLAETAARLGALLPAAEEMYEELGGTDSIPADADYARWYHAIAKAKETE